MTDRFSTLPSYLAERAKSVTLAGRVPALLAHPDWLTPGPWVLWMHGRTAHKELDPGRYLRWLRAGIGVCAIDLPGHGERLDRAYHSGERTLEMLAQAMPEVDAVFAEVTAENSPYRGQDGTPLFDPARAGIGGMSAGGMTTLRRLGDPHPFVCAAVEGATGSFDHMPHYLERHGRELFERIDPRRYLDTFRPIPLLILHSEADEMVPIDGVRAFVDDARASYTRHGADPSLITLHTWPTTGAPREHLGFGRFSNDAKNLQTEFFAKWLNASPPSSV